MDHARTALYANSPEVAHGAVLELGIEDAEDEDVVVPVLQ